MSGNSQQPVGLTEIGNRPERSADEEIKLREKAECRDEKRNFKQQRHRTAQSVIGLVVILAVVGLQHHKAFIALKDLPDMVNTRLEPFEPYPFLFLHCVGAPVKGKYQKIDRKAEGNYRKTFVIGHAVHHRIHSVKKQYKGTENQVV